MEAAAEELEVNVTDLETDGRGNIHVKGAPHRSISTKDVAIGAQFKQGKTISGRGIFLVPLSAVDPETGEMSPATCYAHACLVAEVEVDDETGEVAMVRMDSAYELGRALNPRLVYCSVTGFGQTGPYAERPGYDFLIQGMSGYMDITGDPNGEPQKVGVAVCDLFTALYGVIAIEAALIARERTGRGQHIDLALLDTMGAMLANQAMNYLASSVAPRRMGNAHPNIAPYRTFPTADGYVIVAVGNDAQFQRLCATLGLEALGQDERFATNAARVAKRAELERWLSEKTRHWRRDDLIAALKTAVVPAGPINTIADLFADPQFRARGMRIDVEGAPGVKSPIVMSASPLTLERRSPRLGEHQAEILRELGLG